ncbi:hypothetical protein A3Q56_07690 [Intoshia linei]|uniref:Sodium-dependent multivitamin transporter n=1 Tax=Intoshia linei TaxID=1819745 RepID=A0A177ARH5_9BILA|nr:hypothetical protein A3Q56_07690 [Intoshia linei]
MAATVPTLSAYGFSSAWGDEVVDFHSNLNPEISSIVKFDGGGMVQEEKPKELFKAIVLFLHESGIYRKDTIIEYIVPSNVPIYQVSLSLIASFISAITVLGVPSEIYVNGASYIIICFAYILAILAANTLFIPVYYNCIKTSIFEYLEGRFNRLVAIFFAVIFVIQTIFYSSLALYGPSLAVSTVENVNIWYILCLIAFLSTIYTSLGGMKIVLWSDTIQALLILIGPIFIIFESAINNHGIINIVEKFNDYKKIPFFKFDLDLTTKNTVWQLIISGTIMYMSMYSSNQCEIQRLMTLRSLKKAKRSLWIIVPLKIIITLTMALCGICVNVYYGNEKLEGKNDQVYIVYVTNMCRVYTVDPIIPSSKPTKNERLTKKKFVRYVRLVNTS